ncbi:MAG: 5-formyltetrahydrofolate cyclo-ligase [Clostridiales bacterium]|nr:5-formyltetrahydrofolate cyclo-ligase [Clostridiales bacterium]
MDKKELRQRIAAQKRVMTAEEIGRQSADLTEMFLACPLYKAARNLYAYLSYNQEVRTETILRRAQRDGKRIAVPKIIDGQMVFIWLDDLTAVKEGYCRIPEPLANSPVADDPTALVLVPGLAFDRSGHRLGYGGGFYDRFLQQEPHHPTVALGYDFQLIECVPADSHDRPVDIVLTYSDISKKER